MTELTFRALLMSKYAEKSELGEIALRLTTDPLLTGLDGAPLRDHLIREDSERKDLIWSVYNQVGVWRKIIERSPAEGPPPEITAAAELVLPDMPEAVVHGRLGEICQRRFGAFAIAYAWPAILAAASVCVRVRPEMARILVGLYVSLVGPVGTGKTQAIERANRALGVSPETVMAGSVEGLLEKIGERNGDPVLIAPDERSHMLEKAQIANATFPYVLNRAFYSDKFELTVTHRKPVRFNARLSAPNRRSPGLLSLASSTTSSATGSGLLLLPDCTIDFFSDNARPGFSTDIPLTKDWKSSFPKSQS